MAKPPPFSVQLREIPAARTFQISPELVSEWIKGLPMRDALGAPDPDPDAGQGTATLELYAEDDQVFVHGAFKGHLMVACSRCVEPMRIELDDALRVTFLPRSQLPTEETEDGEDGAVLGAEDLDLFPYEGDWVDLEPLFRELFVLAIPYSPLCAKDCKGLCGQCGTNLNTDTCACEPLIDPRLAKLKGLKPSA